jgi:glucose-6-phosphate-specific signal transduction histidine kinase
MRMGLIMRWRRTANICCALLAAYALVTLLREQPPYQPRTIMLISSLLAFIVAALAAINFMTFRLRKRSNDLVSHDRLGAQFSDGMAAFARGDSVRVNPNPALTAEYKGWLQGWHAAESEARQPRGPLMERQK